MGARRFQRRKQQQHQSIQQKEPEQTIQAVGSQQLPWYESTLLWGAFGAAVAIVLTVVAAMTKDLRWMLILAWPFFVLSLWAMVKNLPSQYPRRVLTIASSLIVAVSLYWLHVYLKPLEQHTVKVAATRSDESKILVEDIQFGSPNKQRNLPFSVQFTNAGNASAKSLKYSWTVGSVSHILSADESHAKFAELRNRVMTNIGNESQNDVQPHERLGFTGYFDISRKEENQVRRKNRFLYLMVFFAYKDKNSDAAHETGYCGFYTRDLRFARECFIDNYQE